MGKLACLLQIWEKKKEILFLIDWDRLSKPEGEGWPIDKMASYVLTVDTRGKNKVLANNYFELS